MADPVTNALRAQPEKLIRPNKTRADFSAKFEELIDSDSQGSRNIEDWFEELLVLNCWFWTGGKISRLLPAPRDMEFDPKQNLFKNLPPLERVTAP